jgi:demethylmenaquinone methyltransferase/2-methoxy-6-polyprenyl-1,4-benzoquinol methylase
MNEAIRCMFGEVAASYDTANHVLTFGLDTLWRRKAARIAAEGGGSRWIDLCTGAGEMAACLLRHASSGCGIVAVDGCAEMLMKAPSGIGSSRVLFAAADVASLPFVVGWFDLATVSFAARNLASGPGGLERHLAEICRILKPGGRLVVVETSQPRSGLIRLLFHAYVRLTVPPLGWLLSGSRKGYAYLSGSIRRFHGADEFAGLIADAGFSRVVYRPLLFGAVAVHRAVK